MEMFVAIPEGWDKWLLDLVAIATVADMVPLVGESRTLAYWGLQVLRKSPRPGIIALCTQMRIRKEELTEDDIGFAIAPRVNAASRMDTPELAFRLLTTKDEKEADQIARELDALNASRKGLVASIVKEAKKTAHARFAPEEKVIVFGSVAWKPALLGLAANSIMDERGGMVCLWGKDANGALKGSCRSDGSVHVAQVFASAHDLFEAHGGHECAGGFTVSHEKVHTLHEDLAARLVNNYSSIPADGNTKMVTPDAHVSLREVSSALLTDITRLAPFGIGNPKPVFSFSRIRIESVKRFGKENNHLELSLACADHGTICRAYDFFKSPESFTEVPRVGGSARVLATIERDTYRRTLALRITDILPE
jgi:single-stranded-DNA-specific exonuclease